MLSYLTDPVLRAPTLGCMLMCVAASLMGVVLFLKKRSLLGESLSHAAYPGVMIGMGVFAASGLEGEGASLGFVLAGAFVCCLFGLKAIDWLEQYGKVKSDAALCFILASLFGLGVTVASWLQDAYPSFSKQAQIYLYGQAATMTDVHIVLYGAMAMVIILFVMFAYRPLQASLFDSVFAESAALVPRLLPRVLFVLLVLSIIIGIRSVGVILMSGMLIAPAVAARQFTERLSMIFILAAFFGLMSGLFGNLLSVEGSMYLQRTFPHERLSLPTGPMIVLVGSFFAFCSLLFAPKRGALIRLIRVLRFRQKCFEENVLKGMWKKGRVSFSSLKESHYLTSMILCFLLWKMEREGWIVREEKLFALTLDGKKRAARIVRLHRLWEAYLADLGWPGERVHRTAEEMEHILTPELEERLSFLLSDPKLDPHSQPIPERGL